MFLMKYLLIAPLLAILPSPVPNPAGGVLDLTEGFWAVSAVDQEGNNFAGSTLHFSTQVAFVGGSALTGFFDWHSNSGAFGREVFVGTLFANNQITLVGTAILAPSSGLALGQYNATLTPLGSQLINGSFFGGEGTIPGNWSAAQIACVSTVDHVSQFTVPWGPLCYATLTETPTCNRFSAKGCAVTCMAMGLNHAGVDINPLELHKVMVEQGDFTPSGDVIWSPAVKHGAALQHVSSIKFHDERTKSILGLETLMCSYDAPVIVRVTKPDGGPHFVLVYGKVGDQFLIRDPGFSNTTLAAYGNNFETRGVVIDPVGDLSDLSFAITGSGRFEVENEQGEVTGADSQGESRSDIPQSTHFIDSISDEITNITPNEPSQIIHIFQPHTGRYRVRVSSMTAGLRTLSMHPFAEDEAGQGLVKLSFVSAPGISQNFEIQYDKTSHNPPQALRVITFDDALRDVQSALTAGGITHPSVAQTLRLALLLARSAYNNHHVLLAISRIYVYNWLVDVAPPSLIRPPFAQALRNNGTWLIQTVLH